MYWKRFLHDFGVANFGFVMPSVRKMKMSDAILKGEDLGYEETEGSYRGCAVGTAWRAKTGSTLPDSGRMSRSRLRSIAEEFDMPVEYVIEADYRHQSGQSRVEVAAWLASKGY